ncbi:hypothetical protein L210DRAFT_370285 [Boletus edulis BED1]|uniref:Uncharacterized protein n=1 Tax=Boletus edulis BED1 TaxID=1328754 RepID=A0AAD4BUD4_BOLED|nr:hypothetical protein L210DRAFT_370285 [Boletus edulis BED1]
MIQSRINKYLFLQRRIFNPKKCTRSGLTHELKSDDLASSQMCNKSQSRGQCFPCPRSPGDRALCHNLPPALCQWIENLPILCFTPPIFVLSLIILYLSLFLSFRTRTHS